MEKEAFFSGYCRQLDRSRIVSAVTENEMLTEVDCCYVNCLYADACTIAQSIREFCKVPNSNPYTGTHHFPL